MNVSVGINLTDADEVIFAGLASPSDVMSFLVAKLAAQESTALMAALSGGNIMAMLSADDQAAINGLIAAVKAFGTTSPTGDGQ